MSDKYSLWWEVLSLIRWTYSQKNYKNLSNLQAVLPVWKVAIFTAKYSLKRMALRFMAHISRFCLMPVFSIQWNQEFSFLWRSAGCREIQPWDEVRCPSFSHVCLGQLPLGLQGRCVPPPLLGSSRLSILQTLVPPPRVGGSGGHSCPAVPSHVPGAGWGALPGCHTVLRSGPSSNPVKLFLLILGGMRGCWQTSTGILSSGTDVHCQCRRDAVSLLTIPKAGAVGEIFSAAAA